MRTEGATTATLLLADGSQKAMPTPRIPTAALQADGFQKPMHTPRIPTAALQARGIRKPMHTDRAPTAALQAEGIRRPMHTDRLPTAALQAERCWLAMHTIVGWSARGLGELGLFRAPISHTVIVGWIARALGVHGLFRAPISHTVIAQLSPIHVVRPLSAALRARALVALMEAHHLRIFAKSKPFIIFRFGTLRVSVVASGGAGRECCSG